jgi:ribosomal protein S18 acetylase RimI-like enzyme
MGQDGTVEAARPAGTEGPSPTLGDYEEVLGRRYDDDPAFVHPDVGFLGRVLAGRSAYLARGRARAFAARNDQGRAVAFCAGFVDPGLQDKTGAATGSIGFFEALDEHGARRVLDDACAWLASEGVTEVWAPFNANPYNRMGAREDRFDEPPFIGCAHDPPSTRAFLLGAGFDQVNRYLNFDIDLARRPWEGIAPAPGVTLRRASRRRFRGEVLEYVRLHNLAFRTVWGEVEISDGEALQMLMRSRLAIEPSFFQFAEFGGETVGFVLCMPDLNAPLAPLRVPLTSAEGIVRIARARRRARRTGLLSLAVAPGHQGRGIGTALVAAACRAAADKGMTGFEYALVADNNEPSKATAVRFGGTVCRTFGIYRRALA